jgi:hypothetical protein
VTIHERLGEVLSILKNILHRYPVLQSTELFAASGSLIAKVKCIASVQNCFYDRRELSMDVHVLSNENIISIISLPLSHKNKTRDHAKVHIC